jgi:hypothetical protein
MSWPVPAVGIARRRGVLDGVAVHCHVSRGVFNVIKIGIRKYMSRPGVRPAAALAAVLAIGLAAPGLRADDGRVIAGAIVLAPEPTGGDAIITPEEQAQTLDDLTPEELAEAEQTAEDSAPPPPSPSLRTTGAIVGSVELEAALAELARTASPRDVPTLLPARYPELAEEFAAYALQFRTDGGAARVRTADGSAIERVGGSPRTVPLTAADVGTCACVLATQTTPMPERGINLYWMVRRHLWREGSQGPEASQWVKVNRTGNSIFGGATEIDSQLVESQIAMTMQLRCRELKALVPLVISGVPIQYPVWGSDCANACGAALHNTGHLYLDGWTHLVRGLTAGANAEVVGFGNYSVNQQVQINRAVQISRAINGLQINLNVTVPGIGTLTLGPNGLTFNYSSSASGPNVGVTWNSPGRRGDTFANLVEATPRPYLTAKDRVDVLFKTASRVLARGKGTAVSRAASFISYGVGVHGYGSCVKDSWYGHVGTWGYESHNGHTDDLRDHLRGFFDFFGLPLTPP